jgi:hypothetical protein
MNTNQHTTSSMLDRRRFLTTAACGFGGIALHSMMAEMAQAASPLALRAPHFPARAKRVIFLFMQGGPSQHDLFDYKPRLARDHGQRMGVTNEQEGVSTVGIDKYLTLGPMAKFSPRGQSGMVMSDLLPHLASVADDLCLLRSVQTDNNAHAIATLQFQTGATTDVRPSMGAWTSYGLGTENQDLPSFITIRPDSDVRTYGSAFLPAAHQGTAISNVPTNPKQAAIRHLFNPETTPAVQRRELDFVQALNRGTLARTGSDAQMEGVIESFELAFRMQAETPKLVDMSGESKATLELYGIGNPATDGTGRACLLARRLSEAGVRFVQVGIPGWDHHGNLRDELPKTCATMDQPAAALIKDLKRRGLFDDTLVLWSGEFGRTPWSQDLSGTAPIDKHGREHQPESFCAWLAGGGVKGGLTHGTTDDFGFRGVENNVHLHDLHATMLHLLGLDHTRLTHRYAGRDFRLTDVYGEVVKEILA